MLRRTLMCTLFPYTTLFRSGVWRESGILKEFPSSGPKVRWRTEIGAGYAGPAVAFGKVYLTDRIVAPKAATPADPLDRKSTRLNSSHLVISYAVFCLKKKKK